MVRAARDQAAIMGNRGLARDGRCKGGMASQAPERTEDDAGDIRKSADGPTFEGWRSKAANPKEMMRNG